MLDWTPPTFRWFSGGETNMSTSAVDHHVARGRGGHAAIVALDERGGERTVTYAQLLRRVREAAASLRALGVGEGDRITVYMPTGVEAIVVMLAALRIGAIHSVVFAGFGAGALGERVRRSGSKLVLCADITYRKGRDVPLKPIVDRALEEDAGDVERVVVLRRGAEDPPWVEGRDMRWEEFLERGAGGDDSAVAVEANAPAFILATSGTTASPKLAVHVHGGYAVGVTAMARWVFGLHEDDVWWSTSDIGWIVGHSYIVDAPLLMGCTTIAYEGALDHPRPDAVHRIMAEQGVTGFFTSPTAVRLLMRHGVEHARAHDLSAVERGFCAGEVLNPPAWEWLQKEVFGDRVPVIDHMWQIETGAPVLGIPYGLGMMPIKPGSAGIALPGWEAEVLTADGGPVEPGETGIMVLRRPFPSLTPTLRGDPERYERDYWARIPGVWFTGDAARFDEDGYVWFSGRADEIIKIADHRIGTIEVETAFLRHPAVAEAGVTGRPDELRGEVIAAFVVLRAGHEPSAELEQELRATVRRELGPLVVIGDVNVVGNLPKTRSGKIMRRVFKAVVTGRDVGDISTIEDEGSVEEAREAWAEMMREVGGSAPA